MRGRRHAKIVATLGPASSDSASICGLSEAGADVFRLNLSHGTQGDNASWHRLLCEPERSATHPCRSLPRFGRHP